MLRIDHCDALRYWISWCETSQKEIQRPSTRRVRTRQGAHRKLKGSIAGAAASSKARVKTCSQTRNERALYAFINEDNKIFACLEVSTCHPARGRVDHRIRAFRFLGKVGSGTKARELVFLCILTPPSRCETGM